jgi:LPXTG-motif cell wall-anchored protein
MAWAAAYYLSTAASLGTLAAVAMQIYVENLDVLDRSDAYAWLGAGAGALLGLWFARKKRNSPTTHRALRIAGASLGFLAIAGGVVMFGFCMPRGEAASTVGVGVAIFMMALLALGVGGIGFCLWLAGFSGRRIAPPPASSDGVPLP